MEKFRIGCLVMAAGNAVRFGKNKLAAEYKGKPLIERTLEAVPRELFSEVVIVTQYEEVSKAAHSFGFEVIWNQAPEKGISETIRLGTEALNFCNAVIYMVADQPLLQKDSVRKVIRTWEENPDKIVGAACRGKKGNPCIFPQKYFEELLTLTGDHGGSTVIRAHPESLLTVDICEEELRDVDTQETLNQLNTTN